MSLVKFTGNTAIKRIHELNSEINYLREQERKNNTYSYIEGETPDIPEYSFSEVASKITQHTNNVMRIRYALHKHNMENTGPLTGRTIDEILVWMPLLRLRISDVTHMRNMQKKFRVTRNNVSEWTEINFDPVEIEKEYKELNQLLVNLQEDVNYLNVNGTFEVDILD